MKFSRRLVPAMFAAAVLVTAELPQAGLPIPNPRPASSEAMAAQLDVQLRPGRNAGLGLTAAPAITSSTHTGSPPAQIPIRFASAGPASTSWLQAAMGTRLPAMSHFATPPSKFRSKVRAVLNRYGCTSSGISINDRRLGRYANGMADWYNNVVLVRSSMPASRVTYVAAHECMHMRQYRAYRGNVKRLSAAMNRIYGGKGFTGLERNADCMTRLMGIRVTNSAYASSCSGAKKTAALKVLKGKPA